jgi:hypothetical protein
LSRLFARFGLAITVIALFAALLGTTSASAATVVNGGFETGNLEGWTLYTSNGEVTWEVQEEEGQLPPFSGTHYAMSNQVSPGTAILYQDIALEPNSSHQLQFAFEYESRKPITIPSPDSLAAELGAPANQQVRIDIMKPTSPITSLEPSDILATVFASSESENLEGAASKPYLEPKLFTVDLSQFAGQTVRLRFAVAVTLEPLYAFVDNVSVTSALLPTPPLPPPTPPPPSNLFTKGKLTLNKKNGTGFLSVNVPDAGALTATDVHSKIAIGSVVGAKAKPQPVFVKTAAVNGAAAGTLKVPIKPTAAAKKILAKKGKLSVRLKLTFVPTGGTAAVQPYSGKLVKTLRPARR